jgi:hypothetical protein
LGGFVGIKDSNTNLTFTNCKNIGKVTLGGEQIATSTTAYTYCIGGFVGYTSVAKITFPGSVNGSETDATKGAVSIVGTAPSGVALGGFIGLSTVAITLDGLKNYGPVQISSACGESNTYRVNIGGIIGVCPGVKPTIQNCENYGHIKYGPTASLARGDLGGIIGGTPSGATISNCKNGGKVEHTSATAVGEQTVAGICGCPQVGTIFNDCVNLASAEIYSNGSSTSNYNVAGITGSTALNSANLYNCDNYGHVNQVKASGGVTQVGGIDGYAYRFGTIDGCDNFGTITFAGTATNKNGNVGGVIGHARFQGANAAADGSTPAGVAAVTNCGNYADQTWGGTASTYYAGGVIGYCRSKESGVATLENLKNVANLTFTSKGSSNDNTYIGGICGTFGSETAPHHIDGGVFYGDFKALDLGLEHLVGLAFGNFRTDTRFVENVQFGGNMVFAQEEKEVEDPDGGEPTKEVVETLIPITAENLYMYAYKYNGENPSVTTEELANENCTVITTKPAVPATPAQ